MKGDDINEDMGGRNMRIEIKNIKDNDIEFITNEVLKIIEDKDMGTPYIFKIYDLDKNFNGFNISIE